jgi:hypothetical protein
MKLLADYVFELYSRKDYDVPERGTKSQVKSQKLTLPEVVHRTEAWPLKIRQRKR